MASPLVPCAALAGRPSAICSLMSRSRLRSNLDRRSGAARSMFLCRCRSLWRSCRSSSRSRSSSLPPPPPADDGRRSPALSSRAFCASSRSLDSLASFSLAASFFSSCALKTRQDANYVMVFYTSPNRCHTSEERTTRSFNQWHHLGEQNAPETEKERNRKEDNKR